MIKLIKCFLFVVFVSHVDSVDADYVKNENKIKVQTLTAKNGVKIWLYSDYRTPFISMKIRFANLGSSYDPNGLEGMAEVLSDAICEGAGGRDSTEVKRSLLSLGIGFSFNVSVDDMFCSVTGLRQTVLAHKLLIKDLIIKPQFDDKQVKIIVKNLSDTHKTNLKNPNYLMQKAFLESAFPSHRYSRMANSTSYEKITGGILRQFWSSAINLDDMFVVFAGAINAEEAVKLVDEIFQSCPSKGKSKPAVKVKPKCLKGTRMVQSDIKQSIIALYSEGISPTHNDYLAYSAANLILGSAFSSRLQKKIREQEGLAYYAYTFTRHYQSSDVLLGLSETSNKTAYKVMNMMKDVIFKLRFDALEQDNSKISEDELVLAKGQLLKDYYKAFSSCGTIASSLMDTFIAGLPLEYFYNYPNLVKSLTLEDIKRVFINKLINPDAVTCIIVGMPVF